MHEGFFRNSVKSVLLTSNKYFKLVSTCSYIRRTWKTTVIEVLEGDVNYVQITVSPIEEQPSVLYIMK